MKTLAGNKVEQDSKSILAAESFIEKCALYRRRKSMLKKKKNEMKYKTTCSLSA